MKNKKIKFNNSIFTITETAIEDGKEHISQIQRETYPQIKIGCFQKDNTLRLVGWNDYQPFELLTKSN